MSRKKVEPELYKMTFHSLLPLYIAVFTYVVSDVGAFSNSLNLPWMHFQKQRSLGTSN